MTAAAPGSVLDDRAPLAGAAPPAAAASDPEPARQRQLGLVMQRQNQSEWCWATVSVSVAAFFDPGSPWTQCTLVNAQLERTDCCAGGAAGACNVPQQLTPALERVGHLSKDFGGSLDIGAIAAQVDAGRPVALCIDWSGGGGHVVVIDGYDQAAGLVDVKDPLFGTSYLPLSGFPARYQGGGSWGWTYLTR